MWWLNLKVVMQLTDQDHGFMLSLKTKKNENHMHMGEKKKHEFTTN
jgi:hypothetical protein